MWKIKKIRSYFPKSHDLSELAYSRINESKKENRWRFLCYYFLPSLTVATINVRLINDLYHNKFNYPLT